MSALVRPRTIVVLVGLAFLLVFTGTGAARAHSTLVSSCPASTEVSSDLQDTGIQLDFGSPLIDDGLAQIDLLGDDGQTELAIGPTILSEDRLRLTAEVPAELNLEPGTYIVRYRALSVDGDESDGGFQFVYDPEADTQSATCDGVETGGGAGGWVLLAVGLVAVAALLFFLRPRRTPHTDGV